MISEHRVEIQTLQATKVRAMQDREETLKLFKEFQEHFKRE
jgi:hypothetical protein